MLQIARPGWGQDTVGRGYIGIMEKKMETVIVIGVYWGDIRIMEKTMETTGGNMGL